MTIQDFKDKTKATELNQNILSGAIATFKNNEKYTIKILADENNNGYVNSGDIFVKCVAFSQQMVYNN